MLNTEDLRNYTGIGTGYSPEMMMERAADEIDALRARVEAMRHSLSSAIGSVRKYNPQHGEHLEKCESHLLERLK